MQMKLKRAAAIFALIVPATLFAQPTQVPTMPTQPRAPAPPAMPPPTVQTGATWSEWDAARRLGYVEGFKSGTLWVASTSIVPPFAFKNEAVRSQAQKIWE